MFKRRCNANQYHEYVKEKVKKHLNRAGGKGGGGGVVTRSRRVND
jgi:hypothetical protein